MKKKLYSLVLFFFVVNVYCRQINVDSLETILKSSSFNDTNSVWILNKLCEEYKFSKPKQAMEYAQKGKNISEKLIYKLGIGLHESNIGEVYLMEGSFDKALLHFMDALKIFESIQSKKNIADSYNDIGRVLNAKHDYGKALEYYKNALFLYEQINDKVGIGNILNNIGVVFYYEKELDSALAYYKKDMILKESIGDLEDIALSNNNIGFVYEVKQDYKEALKYYFHSKEIYTGLKNKNGIAALLTNIGAVYAAMNRDSAIVFLYQSMEISREINYKPRIADNYEVLKSFYENRQDYENAYKYQKLFSEIKDSLFNEESSRQIAEMQTKYDTEKKEQQITLLNKDKELQHAQLTRQKIIIWTVAAGLLVVLTLSIFIFRERRKSEKLLLNILPEETAKELKVNGKARAKHYESVTVMFTDFKGFTNIAEKLSAEELVNELDFLFKKFDEIISKYNIEKIKTIGDAYMCVSGLPTPNQNHAENIVRASLEIQQWMIHQSGKWQLRIGIHSGPVTAGVVGHKKFAYDIWGDTVNTASRMESSGEAGRVNISGTTNELIKDKFASSFRGKIPAKNKGEIEMYFIKNIM